MGHDDDSTTRLDDEMRDLNPVWKAVKPFVNGGLSGMGATCVIQPLDIVKVRLQLGATGGPFGVAAGIIKNDGFGALYTGLSAGLLRQATYTTARLGIHSELMDYLKKQNKGEALPLSQKAGAGLAAGGLGALFGSPADLSLIRMQADKTLPVEQRRKLQWRCSRFGRHCQERRYRRFVYWCE